MSYTAEPLFIVRSQGKRANDEADFRNLCVVRQMIIAAIDGLGGEQNTTMMVVGGPGNGCRTEKKEHSRSEK